MDLAHAPETSHEILTQLRLLQSAIQVKLEQFDRAPWRGRLVFPRSR
jgi:hypothetical protein